MRVVLKNLREGGITEIGYSSLLFWINEAWTMQVCHIGVEPKEINLLASRRTGESGGLVGAVFCH